LPLTARQAAASDQAAPSAPPKLGWMRPALHKKPVGAEVGQTAVPKPSRTGQVKPAQVQVVNLAEEEEESEPPYPTELLPLKPGTVLCCCSRSLPCIAVLVLGR